MNSMTERTISLPGALQAVIQTVEQAVGHFFPDQTLRMGGGTVLQARWDHRLSDILASKLIHRICGGGIVELRDLYDLAAAAHHEPSALALAAGVIRSHQMKRIEVLLDLLPADWMSASDKPLLGLADDPFDFRPNAIKQLLLDYRAHAPTAPMATQEQTGNATHARS